MKKHLILGVISIVLLVSCTIQKKLYSNGYTVTKRTTVFNHNKIKSETNSTSITQSNLSKNRDIDKIKSFKSNKLIKTSKHNLSLEYDAVNCDTLYLRDNGKVVAQVLEVGVDIIKYKECSNLNGPTFSVKKKDVEKIVFSNGTSTVFKKKTDEVSKDIENGVTSIEEDFGAEKRSETEVGENDRSFLVAALLWWFLGIIGIHRFYLGYYGIGILYFLTGGLCGIGWLVDGIMLLTGDLKPKNGKYVTLN